MAARNNPEDANQKGKGFKHGENLIQRTRAAILNTFDAVESQGKKLSEILAEEFKKNPIKFMELAVKAMPKEVHKDVNHSHSAIDRLSVNEIEQEINRIRELASILEGEGSTTTGRAEKESSKRKIH